MGPAVARHDASEQALHDLTFQDVIQAVRSLATLAPCDILPAPAEHKKGERRALVDAEEVNEL